MFGTGKTRKVRSDQSMDDAFVHQIHRDACSAIWIWEIIPRPNLSSFRGYETLSYDVMIGDPTLFMRADMVEQSWRIVQPVLDASAAEKVDFPDYDSGSDGPKAVDELLARGGDRVWRPVAPSLADGDGTQVHP